MVLLVGVLSPPLPRGEQMPPGDQVIARRDIPGGWPERGHPPYRVNVDVGGSTVSGQFSCLGTRYLESRLTFVADYVLE